MRRRSRAAVVETPPRSAPRPAPPARQQAEYAARVDCELHGDQVIPSHYAEIPPCGGRQACYARCVGLQRSVIIKKHIDGGVNALVEALEESPEVQKLARERPVVAGSC